MQHQSFDFEIKQAPNEQGEFSGYASVFGEIDNGMDVVAPGAFAKSLEAGRKVKMLWQHDMSEVIGAWSTVEETEKGLYVVGKLAMGVQRGREARELLGMGAIDSMSIGYRTRDYEMVGDGRVRKLKEVDLFEVSLVTVPMLESATVTDIKSAKTEREFERFLRDAGYSRKEATAIALHGFKGLTDQRDAEVVDETPDLTGIIEQLQNLKGQIDGDHRS